jgi:hypothetical protein
MFGSVVRLEELVGSGQLTQAALTQATQPRQQLYPNKQYKIIIRTNLQADPAVPVMNGNFRTLYRKNLNGAIIVLVAFASNQKAPQNSIFDRLCRQCAQKMSKMLFAFF